MCVYLVLIDIVKQFSKVVIPIYIPSVMYESYSRFISLPTFSIISLFNFSSSDGCVTESRCSFSLNFPDG